MMSTLPATRSLQGRRRAAIGNVLHLHLRHHLEHLGGEMRGGAIALGGGGELAGIGFRIGDQLGDVLGRDLRVDHQRVRHPSHDDDRDELERVEPELRIEVLVDHQRRRRRGEQRVAVRLGLEHHLGADIAGCAGAVLDHDRLSPFARQPIAEHARHHVGGAAGRERHDDLDRSRRIVLRPRAGQPGEHSRQHQSGAGQTAGQMPTASIDAEIASSHPVPLRNSSWSVARLRPLSRR